MIPPRGFLYYFLLLSLVYFSSPLLLASLAFTSLSRLLASYNGFVNVSPLYAALSGLPEVEMFQ